MRVRLNTFKDPLLMSGSFTLFNETPTLISFNVEIARRPVRMKFVVLYGRLQNVYW